MDQNILEKWIPASKFSNHNSEDESIQPPGSHSWRHCTENITTAAQTSLSLSTLNVDSLWQMGENYGGPIGPCPNR